jgi:hypothetical protein
MAIADDIFPMLQHHIVARTSIETSLYHLAIEHGIYILVIGLKVESVVRSLSMRKRITTRAIL